MNLNLVSSLDYEYYKKPTTFFGIAEMPKTRFLKTNVAASSGNAPERRHRVAVSKEVRATLTAARREAVAKYQQDLQNAFGVVEGEIRTIANAHAKSTRRVRSDLHMAPQTSMNSHSKKSAWNAFCWKKSQEKENGGIGKPFLSDLKLVSTDHHKVKNGKDVLLDLVQNTKEEYNTLTLAEKEELILEFEKVKATKAKGFRTSARSRVNDVTQTMSVLENEVSLGDDHPFPQADVF